MATTAKSAPSDAAKATEKRKPVFRKVDQLQPGTSGHTLTVKVVDSKTVLQKGRSVGLNQRPTRISECLVGDETGTIIFTARNEQNTRLYSSGPRAQYNNLTSVLDYIHQDQEQNTTI